MLYSYSPFRVFIGQFDEFKVGKIDYFGLLEIKKMYNNRDGQTKKSIKEYRIFEKHARIKFYQQTYMIQAESQNLSYVSAIGILVW